MALEDLVEVDSLIFDLADRDYITSANAYEKLKRKCSDNWGSDNWEVFKYLQERVHDGGVPEWVRNDIYDIIYVIRARVFLR